MERLGCLYYLLCICTLSKTLEPTLPPELAKEIFNGTDLERKSCMDDFVVCLQFHQVLISKAIKAAKNLPDAFIAHPPDINQAETMVCGINKDNYVQQFDTVCDIIFTNCVLRKDDFWTYIGDGSCTGIMEKLATTFTSVVANNT